MRKKHVPMRTCVGCRTARPKRDLLRIVRTPDGNVEIDPIGKKPGRGAYICHSVECLSKALKTHQLERALGCSIDAELSETLHRSVHEQSL